METSTSQYCSVMEDSTASTNAHLADECKTRGNILYQNGEYKTAAEWYTMAIQHEPSNPLFYSNRCATYLMMNMHSEAFADASKSISLDPSNTKALLRYAKCCINLGKLQESGDVCGKLTELGLSSSEFDQQLDKLRALIAHHKSYEIQTAHCDFRHALFEIGKCIELAPGSLDFKLNKMKLLLQLKRFTEAKLWIETVVRSNGASADVLHYRGLCLYYLDHLDKAMSHFQHVLRVHPDHTETQQAYKRAKQLARLKEEGNQLIHSRRFSKAFEVYSSALQVDTLHDAINAKLYCNRACAAFNLDRFEESLKDCDTAISLDPTYTRAHIRRAKCLTALEQYDKAVEVWTTIVSMDSSAENQRALQEAKKALDRSKQFDYYKVLGLSRTASLAQIKQAYKKHALLHHPDRHTNSDEAKQKEEERKFKEVGEAYSVLSDPQKRQRYDNGVYSPDQSDAAHFQPHKLFTQLFPEFRGRGNSVYYCFT